MLTHIFIGIKKEDANLPIKYIRLLGFNKKGQKYINTIKKQTTLPILTKINEQDRCRSIELKTSLIYEIITNKTQSFEQKNKHIIK